MNATADDLNVVLRAVVERAIGDGYVVTAIAARQEAALLLLTEITDNDAIVVVLTKAKVWS